MARREARIGQSRLEVERFCEDFTGWLARWRAADRFSQYVSQLDAVEGVVEENLGLIRSELDGLSPSLPVRDVYDVCLVVDRQLVWVRRFWSYFREKWNQRDDPQVGTVLAAADEVVWSSYAPVFRRLDVPVGPPPLPFISSEFSAHAVARRHPPGDLRRSDRLLLQTLGRLPVAVVGLPEACVASPWWLIVLPHEVGHQVAFEVDGGRVPKAVGELAASAAVRATGMALADGDWQSWGHELFADAFAGAMVGGAHLWALSELEGGGDEMLVRRVSGYPPPLVRQAVAADLLRLYGLSEAEALPPVPVLPTLAELDVPDDARERVGRQLAAATAVAEALVEEPIVADLGLRDLLPPRLAQIGGSGACGRWRRALAGDAEPQAEPELEAARLATAGALAEWAATMAESDEEARLARAVRLRDRMLDVVPYCREEGTRAAGETQDGAELAALTRAVAQEVRALPPEETAWPAGLESFPESAPVL